MTPDIIISSQDLDRLEALLETLPASLASSRDALLAELQRADIREPHEIAPTVVTMNSRVRFAVEPSGETFSLTLSYPANMHDGPDRISILSPVGAAMLGLSAGAMIDWPGPDGNTLRVRVLEVCAPPGSGLADTQTGRAAQ
ncbi:nucleoside diphosphate kinase regulator [Massilia solisilvae]|uniref:Nucleoside diphosphate kinase regulator n=2 Tax=Massilia solisilvae TaxID=1811225 RepID=A0ABT2BQS0_9BURK|nr:nucleoside diphosphate kinase regulator [Massilia solisilvae]